MSITVNVLIFLPVANWSCTKSIAQVSSGCVAGCRSSWSFALTRRLGEAPFGWIKATVVLRKTRHRGLSRVGWIVTLTATAANVIRLSKLLGITS